MLLSQLTPHLTKSTSAKKNILTITTSDEPTDVKNPSYAPQYTLPCFSRVVIIHFHLSLLFDVIKRGEWSRLRFFLSGRVSCWWMRRKFYTPWCKVCTGSGIGRWGWEGLRARLWREGWDYCHCWSVSARMGRLAMLVTWYCLVVGLKLPRLLGQFHEILTALSMV